jgi:hypothetical protein
MHFSPPRRQERQEFPRGIVGLNRVEYVGMEPSPVAKPQRNYDRIYNTVLAVGCGCAIFAIVTNIVLTTAPFIKDENQRFSLIMATSTEVVWLLMTASVLLVRILLPAKRKWITKVYNIVSLFLFPIGTVIGIYGLRKVDRNTPD